MTDSIKMSEINQFRSEIHNIKATCDYHKIDYPVLKAHGTVKVHGTNASFACNDMDGWWAQSKKAKLTVGDDNAGFAAFTRANIDSFLKLYNDVRHSFYIDASRNTIVIYGEWAGCGVKRKVAIKNIDKTFFIFGIKISPMDGSPNYWVDSKYLRSDNDRIYNIEEFQTFDFDVDFNNPMMSNNDMVKAVKDVEEECPVAKHFGHSGLGEGVVFTTFFRDTRYIWKMKGKKHAGKSKVKVPKVVDEGKLKLIAEVAEKVTPEWRMAQMYDEVVDRINGGRGDIKQTGNYIKAVNQDVLKEDVDIITDADLTWKDVQSTITTKSRKYFMIMLDEEAEL